MFGFLTEICHLRPSANQLKFICSLKWFLDALYQRLFCLLCRISAFRLNNQVFQYWMFAMFLQVSKVLALAFDCQHLKFIRPPSDSLSSQESMVYFLMTRLQFSPRHHRLQNQVTNRKTFQILSFDFYSNCSNRTTHNCFENST